MGKQGGALHGIALVLLMLAGTGHAAYSEECRALATKLEQDPGAMKVGELDLLKSCLGDLQRIAVMGETPPTKKPPLACPPPPVPVPCPVCKVCPVVEQSPSVPRERDKKRAEDLNLRPVLKPF